MSRTERNDDHLSYVARTLRTTEKGVHIRASGKEFWLSKAQTGKWPEEGQNGTLVLPRWLALQHGLAKPDDVDPGPASMADEPATSDSDDREFMAAKDRLAMFERDMTNLATQVSRMIRGLAAMVRCVEALMDKDTGPAAEALIEAKCAASSNPLDHVGKTAAEPEAAEAKDDGPGF